MANGRGRAYARRILCGTAAAVVLTTGCSRDTSSPPHAIPPSDAGLVVSVAPDHGDHTTVFAGEALGFTPNGNVTVSAKQPDGADYPKTYPKTADQSGKFTWSWQWESGEPDGLWTIKFLDQGSGKTSSTTITITEAGSGPASAVTPTVHVSPSTGGHTTVFAGTASGFTPNGKVTVSATMPGGAAYKRTYPKTTDQSGKFSWSWQWESGEPDGRWVIKFLDHSSGKTTSTTITITGNRSQTTTGTGPTVKPAVRVSPSVGGHATLFAGTASGFTPNGKVTVSATMPGGAAYPTTYPKTANRSGEFTWSWRWDPGEPDGRWTIKFLDHNSGKTTSTTITITITSQAAKPAVSVSPASGGHSTLFAGTASGFTPNGKVTVSATMPGGAAYPTTYPKTANPSGGFTWSWRWDPGEPDGRWTIKFLDHNSGKTTSTTITIAADS